jgi:hypothetical protein
VTPRRAKAAASASAVSIWSGIATGRRLREEIAAELELTAPVP